MAETPQAKQRQIMAETTAWRQVRNAAQAGLQVGLDTGDFAEAPRDPLAAQEAGTPGYPPTAKIEEAYQTVLTTGDLVTRTTYLTGLELQLNLLESARRTSSVLRGTRATALAQLHVTPDDASKRNDHLDDLLLSDDLPIGPPPETT